MLDLKTWPSSKMALIMEQTLQRIMAKVMLERREQMIILKMGSLWAHNKYCNKLQQMVLQKPILSQISQPISVPMMVSS